MDTVNVKTALRDPTNCSIDELNEILEAQLSVVRHLRNQGITVASTATSAAELVNKTNKGGRRKRHSMKHLSNII